MLVDGKDIRFPEINTSLDYKQFVDVYDACDFIVSVGDYVADKHNTVFDIYMRNNQSMSSVESWSPNVKKYSPPISFNINRLLNEGKHSFIKEFQTYDGNVKGIPLTFIFKCVKSIFHEGRHLEQVDHILSGGKDNVLDLVLPSYIAESSCSDHYFKLSNYFKVAMEVDAQIVGLHNAYLFCSEICPNVDWLDIMIRDAKADERFESYFRVCNFDVKRDSNKVDAVFTASLFDSFLRYDNTYDDLDTYSELSKSLLYRSVNNNPISQFMSIFNIRSTNVLNSIKNICNNDSNMLVCDSIRTDLVLNKFNKSLRATNHMNRSFDKVFNMHSLLNEVSEMRYNMCFVDHKIDKAKLKKAYDQVINEFNINYNFMNDTIDKDFIADMLIGIDLDNMRNDIGKDTEGFQLE